MDKGLEFETQHFHRLMILKFVKMQYIYKTISYLVSVGIKCYYSVVCIFKQCALYTTFVMSTLHVNPRLHFTRVVTVSVNTLTIGCIDSIAKCILRTLIGPTIFNPL